MKNRFYLVVVLFLVSCKVTSLDLGFAGKWEYSEHFCHYTLELHNDRSFTYTRQVGCFGGVYDGTWTNLNAHTILLSFPRLPGEDMLMEALVPLSAGKEVQIQIIGGGIMKIDSLEKNAILKRVVE
jgi:hypothetical protein